MTFVDAQFAVVSLTVLQAAGLLSAILARMSEGSRGETLCQRLFLACLTLVGLTTAMSLSCNVGSWIFGSFVLCSMVIAAIWDLRISEPVEAC